MKTLALIILDVVIACLLWEAAIVSGGPWPAVAVAFTLGAVFWNVRRMLGIKAPGWGKGW